MDGTIDNTGEAYFRRDYRESVIEKGEGYNERQLSGIMRGTM
jgi:hypothetical protein